MNDSNIDSRKANVRPQHAPLINLAREGSPWAEVVSTLNSLGHLTVMGTEWTTSNAKQAWSRYATAEDRTERGRVQSRSPFGSPLRTPQDVLTTILDLMAGGSSPESVAEEMNRRGIKPRYKEEWTWPAISSLWRRYSTPEDQDSRTNNLRNRRKRVSPVPEVLEHGVKGVKWADLALSLSNRGATTKTGKPLTAAALANYWQRWASEDEKAKRAEALLSRPQTRRRRAKSKSSPGSSA